MKGIRHFLDTTAMLLQRSARLAGGLKESMVYFTQCKVSMRTLSCPQEVGAELDVTLGNKTAYGPSTCSDKCLSAQLDQHYGKDTNPSRPLQQSSSDKRQSIVNREEAEVLMDFFT